LTARSDPGAGDNIAVQQGQCAELAGEVEFRQRAGKGDLGGEPNAAF
jgi:hypothetical protein